MRLLVCVTLVLIISPIFSLASNKVLLSSVKTLTLYADKFTTGSRSSPIPQLRCIDGKSTCKNHPSSVQCYNMGSDGTDVQWKCEAQLPQNVQFDSLQVQCEGYKYPDDPYILAGSCGLTYSLKPVGSSSSSGHHRHHHKHHHSSSRSRDSVDKASNAGFSPFLVVAVFLAAGYAIYIFCLAPSRQQRHGNDSGDAGQGSFPNAPPPPYSESDAGGATPQYGFRPEYTAGASGAGSKYGGYPQQQHQPPREPDTNAAAGSGPGFWTGAALGGLAGYLFGNSGGATSTASHYHSGYHGSGYHGSSSFARTPSSSSSSAGSSCDGGEPVTRTGYATTRRR